MKLQIGGPIDGGTQKMYNANEQIRLRVGWIVTLSDEDEIDCDEGVVKIVPFYKFKARSALGQ